MDDFAKRGHCIEAGLFAPSSQLFLTAVEGVEMVNERTAFHACL